MGLVLGQSSGFAGDTLEYTTWCPDNCVIVGARVPALVWWCVGSLHTPYTTYLGNRCFVWGPILIGCCH